MLNLGSFWAIYPPAMSEFTATYNALLCNSSVFAGPADDAQRQGLPIQTVGNTAFITLSGPMIKNSRYYWSSYASTQATERAVKSAAADQEIENIVIVTDSPGGSVDGVAELADTVTKAAKVKNVVAQINGGMAASAAYWAVSGASKIYAGRNDLIGSIGARIMLVDSSEAATKEGLKFIPIDTGTFKSAGAQGTEITEEHIEDFQRIVDGYYDDFVSSIAAGRNISKDEVLKSADGRVFFAADAQSRGLIDGVQTLDETIQQLTEQSPRAGRRTQTARNRLKMI